MPKPPAAAGDHRHRRRERDGQPGRHLLRPPHDRGDRRRRWPTSPGPTSPRVTCSRMRELWAAVEALDGGRPRRAAATLLLGCASSSSAACCGCCATAARRSTSRRRWRRSRRARLLLVDRFPGRRRRGAGGGGSPSAGGLRGGGRAPRRWPAGRGVAAAAHRLRHHRGRLRPRPPGRRGGRRLLGAVQRLDLDLLWDRVGALPRNDRWQTHARAGLRDDLLGATARAARRGAAGRRRLHAGRACWSTEWVGPTSAASSASVGSSARSAPAACSTSRRCRSPCASSATSCWPAAPSADASVGSAGPAWRRRAPDRLRRRGRRPGAGTGASCRAAGGTGATCPRAGPAGRRWP